jgi:phage tail-like protein
MNVKERGPQARGSRLTVSHVADFCRRHPGETVTFFTRVEVAAPLAGFTLRITVPPGLNLGDYRSLDDPDRALPLVTWDDGANHLIWEVETESRTAAQYEYQVEARVAPTQTDLVLESRARVTAEVNGEALIGDEETTTLAVSAKGEYLKYLPAVYQDDDLMGRFLMLFESFWAPIEQQIDSLPLYFDPRLTPPEFLPWLASWIALVLDERWPEHKRRRLLRSAASLYRKRGTRHGLAEYLEIYTGVRPRIVEHRANNFILGPEARLGLGVALGTVNVPHTFTVLLRLPPVRAEGGEEERAQQELERRHKIKAILDAEKPAHTAYDLRLEIDPALGAEEPGPWSEGREREG